MQRDDEYIRQLMLEMEADRNPFTLVMLTLAPSKEEKKRWYHLKLLSDYGYVDNVGRDSVRLTAQGHDYLNAIRDPGIWQRTKATVAETGGNATLDILKQLAIGFLKKQIAERTDIEF